MKIDIFFYIFRITKKRKGFDLEELTISFFISLHFIDCIYELFINVLRIELFKSLGIWPSESL